MTANFTPDESFEFVLMRERATDAEGQLVNENSADPAAWERADAATGVEVLGLGRGRLTVTEPNARAFVESHFAMEVAADITYLRAKVVMGETSDREPAMSDLVGVLLPDGRAMIFEVLLSAADLESEPIEEGAVVFVSLAPGEVVLQSRPDLGLVDTGAAETDSEARHVH